MGVVMALDGRCSGVQLNDAKGVNMSWREDLRAHLGLIPEDARKVLVETTLKEPPPAGATTANMPRRR